MSKKLGKIIALVVVFAHVLSTVISVYAQPSDISKHWAAGVINKWLSKGLADVQEDGRFKPDEKIKRHEFYALVNNVFNFTEKGKISFSDVASRSKYAEDIEKAVGAGYLQDVNKGKAMPFSPISRVDAIAIVVKVFELKALNQSSLSRFSDSDKIPAAFRDAVSAMAENGYIDERTDKKLLPHEDLTRAQAIKMLDNVMGEIYNKAGTYNKDVKSNLVININNVTLKNLTVHGDLYLTEGIGEGDVTLDNVTVKGKSYVRGGGKHSIIVKDSALAGVMTVSKKDGNIRVVASGKTSIPNVQLNSGVILEEDGRKGKGFENVLIPKDSMSARLVKLDGAFANVTVEAPGAAVEVTGGSVDKLEFKQSAENAGVKLINGSINEINISAGKVAAELSGGAVSRLRVQNNAVAVKIEVQGSAVGSMELKSNTAVNVVRGSVEKVDIDKTAAGTSIQLARSASITNLIANAGATIKGQGRIDIANINAASVTIDTRPVQIHVASGITANIGGTTANPTASVSVSAIDRVVMAGGTTTSVVTATPWDASLTYTSSNPNVAVVNSLTGVITGISSGTSYIYVTGSKTGYFTSSTSYMVTVIDNNTTTIVVNASNRTVNKGSTTASSVAVYPGDAVLTYSSGNSNIASVNSVTGLISGINEGTTTIYVTAVKQGYSSITSSFTVTVLNANATIAPNAANITVTNNPVGTSDVITVSGLAPGDIVKVYDALTGGTLLGTSPAVAIQESTGTVTIAQLGTGAGTIYVTVTNPGKAESAPRTAKAYVAELAAVEAPAASPAAGTVPNGTAIVLSCGTPDASIYYTTDGSTPGITKTLYTAPIEITANTTIKAIAVKTGMTDSSVITASYTVSTEVVAPVVTNITATDTGNNRNGSDLQVTFDKASNENRVDTYRVIVVKAAGSLTLAQANALQPERYTTVAKTGAGLIVQLDPEALDSDGHPITNASYKVYVLTVADGTNATINALSVPVSAVLTNTASAPAAANIVGVDTANNNDGSDIQITFDKALDESKVAAYRVIIVKASKSLDLAGANALAAANYTNVPKTGQDLIVTLSSTSRDSDGSLISNGAYKIYVLSVADGINATINNLSSPVSLLLDNDGAPTVANILAIDVGNSGNGSDLQVTFDKASDETKIHSYRVIVVKASKTLTFVQANALPAIAYKEVGKVGANLFVQLDESDVDSDGDLIRNGSYKVYVLSVADGVYTRTNTLSVPANVTLAVAAPAVSNVMASDIGNQGNGADLHISFSKVPDESLVDSYRIIVVKATKGLTLNEANSVLGGNYTYVAKTGSDQTITLGAASRDSDGALITNGSYKVYVMTVSNGTSTTVNALSAPVNAALVNTISAPAVTNVNAIDVGNSGNGTDLRVTFNKASDEARVGSYRVIVVKEEKTITLEAANLLTVSYYTSVLKTGSNLSITLSSSARDSDGAFITNGEYKVYVLTVADGTVARVNALSTPVSVVLTNTQTAAVSNVAAADIANNGNGSDMRVSFSKVSDETRVAAYRIIVVKSTKSIGLDSANALTALRYTEVSKTGADQLVILGQSARDSDGDLIVNGTYKVYVLTIADGVKATINALSAFTSVTLANVTPADAVSNVTAADTGDENNGSDLQVTFDKAADETKVGSYRVIVVKASKTLDLAAANAVGANNYTQVAKTGANLTVRLGTAARDSDGTLIANGSYKVYILSVADGINAAVNALAPAVSVVLTDTLAPSVRNITAWDISDNGNGSDLLVSFDKVSDETRIDSYRVIVVKISKTLNREEANALAGDRYTVVNTTGANVSVILSALAKDSDGDQISSSAYRIYVLTVANGSTTKTNALAGGINVSLAIQAPVVGNIVVSDIGNNGNGSDLRVNFDKAADESRVASYRVIVVKAGKTLTLEEANNLTAANYKVVAKTGSDLLVMLDATSRDSDGELIANGSYRVYVMTIGDGVISKANALAPPVQITLQ